MKLLVTILCLSAVILVLTMARPESPLTYLAIGGIAALLGCVWLTRRHRARGQVSW